MDLLTFVTSKYIEQLDAPRGDTDQEWASHALDAAMEQEEASVQVPSSRRQLLTAYMMLTVLELDALPIHVHEWFLEQICNSPDLPNVDDLDARISRTYFLQGKGLYRYICVSALLVLDERLRDRRTHVQSIWTFILDFHNFEGWDKAIMIGELTDILLDVGHLSAHPRYADQALRELWADTAEFREVQGAIADRVGKMAERYGLDRSSTLLSLIRRPSR